MQSREQNPEDAPTRKNFTEGLMIKKMARMILWMLLISITIMAFMELAKGIRPRTFSNTHLLNEK